MKCPACDNSGPLGIAFTPVDVPADFGSTWVCRKCDEHIGVASCDACGEDFPEDELTDEGPILCKNCAELANLH